VSSYLPEAGQSLSEFGDSDGASAPFLDVDLETGTFGVRPELLVETFLQDCDSDVQAQAQAAARLARQSVQVTAQPVGAAAWKRTSSTYLVCTQDRGTPPRLQGEFRASRRDDGRARHRPPPLPVAAGRRPGPAAGPVTHRPATAPHDRQPPRVAGGVQRAHLSAQDLVVDAYAAFNRRDVKALLDLVSEDMDWPDGDDRLVGKAAVKQYWLRQWTTTRTHGEPLRFTAVSPQELVVDISQTVQDLDGRALSRGLFQHSLYVAGGLIKRLDISPARRD